MDPKSPAFGYQLHEKWRDRNKYWDAEADMYTSDMPNSTCSAHRPLVMPRDPSYADSPISLAVTHSHN